MNFIENIREGMRSIAGNRLRTVLTALIIAIGITSLVGILTAIDGLQSSVDASFAGLGANTFNITARQEVARRSGRVRKQDEPIDYHDAVQFKRRFPYGATIAVSSVVSDAAQAKFGSRKTNPNVQLVGGDNTYLAVKGFTLKKGRNLSTNDLSAARSVAILGSEVAGTLFQNKIDPLNQVIRVSGVQYQVVGVLDKKGGMTGGGDDRIILIPLDNGRALAGKGSNYLVKEFNYGLFIRQMGEPGQFSTIVVSISWPGTKPLTIVTFGASVTKFASTTLN